MNNISKIIKAEMIESSDAREVKVVCVKLPDDLTNEEVQRILSSKCTPNAFATDEELQRILAKKHYVL